MYHRTPTELLATIRQAYQSDIPEEQTNPKYVDTPFVSEAREVLSGVIGILRHNPDVNVECHFESQSK